METLDLLRVIWFILIGVLLAGYSILDGFDLGIGSLLPFLARNDVQKKMLFRSIWPVWDGNEVWLLTAGGALFAAFPHAYATVFSGFYLALMLVLFALIFRAVSLEFWHYDDKRKKIWGWAFAIGSFLPSLLYGVALGNVIVGVPLDSRMEFMGDFFTLLRPYPLALGLTGLLAILVQGSTYAALKTEGELQERARTYARVLGVAFTVMLLLSLAAAMIYLPHSRGNIAAWVALVFVIACGVMLRHFLKRGEDGRAFLMSSLSFAGLWGIAAAVHFPNLVKSDADPSLSLTIYKASSSLLTLKVMLVIALIGMPLVIAYTAYVYRIFRGKVRE